MIVEWKWWKYYCPSCSSDSKHTTSVTSSHSICAILVDSANIIHIIKHKNTFGKAMLGNQKYFLHRLTNAEFIKTKIYNKIWTKKKQVGDFCTVAYRNKTIYKKANETCFNKTNTYSSNVFSLVISFSTELGFLEVCWFSHMYSDSKTFWRVPSADFPTIQPKGKTK